MKVPKVIFIMDILYACLPVKHLHQVAQFSIPVSWPWHDASPRLRRNGLGLIVWISVSVTCKQIEENCQETCCGVCLCWILTQQFICHVNSTFSEIVTKYGLWAALFNVTCCYSWLLFRLWSNELCVALTQQANWGVSRVTFIDSKLTSRYFPSVAVEAAKIYIEAK